MQPMPRSSVSCGASMDEGYPDRLISMLDMTGAGWTTYDAGGTFNFYYIGD
jgi:hypothetical protein